jgi:transcriptional regulator with XRE-family HTH domain
MMGGDVGSWIHSVSFHASEVVLSIYPVDRCPVREATVSDTIDSSPRRRHHQVPVRDACESDEGHRGVSAGDTSHADVGPALGSNLRRLRMRRGLSLERLSKQSRVSRAMLSQIELGRSAPSVNVVWRIASALSVPFSALLSVYPGKSPRVLHARKAQVTSNHEGSFSWRALFPREPRRSTEFYQLTVQPHGIGAAAAYARQCSSRKWKRTHQARRKHPALRRRRRSSVRRRRRTNLREHKRRARRHVPSSHLQPAPRRLTSSAAISGKHPSPAPRLPSLFPENGRAPRIPSHLRGWVP